MEFADLSAASPSVLQSRFKNVARKTLGRVELPIVSTTYRSRSGSNSFASIATVDIDPANLLLHKTGTASLASAMPTVFRMRVGGEFVDLAVLDYVFDPSANLYHVGAVPLQTDGQARFTVTADGSALVGTVTLGPSIYRFRSLPNSDRQVEYRILDGMSARYLRLAANDSIAPIEARHVQMARVADMQPIHFSVSDSGVTEVIGGALGDITVHRSGAVLDRRLMRAEVEQFFERRSSLTGFDEAVHLELDSATDEAAPSEEALTNIGFRQVIDGVPVELRGYIDVNTATGQVRSYVARFFPRSAVLGLGSQLVEERDAVSFALDALSAQGISRGDVSSVESELQYLVVDENELRPSWFIELRVADRSFAVRVDAITGKGEITRRGGIAFRHATCIGADSAAVECNPSAVVYTESATGQKVCTGGSLCDVRHQHVWDKMQEIEGAWTMNGENCCSQLASGLYPDQVKILVDSDFDPATHGLPANTIAYYDPITKTIVLPPPGTHGLDTGVDPTSPATDDVFSHEAFHAYEHAYNPSALADTNVVPRSIAEGLADVNAVLTNGALDPQLSDWQVGNGEVSGVPHNLAEPKSLSDYRAQGEPHANGVVIGNFFYRLSQEPGVDLPTDLFRVLEGSWKRLSQATNSAIWELVDFKSAALAAAAGDSTLIAAINKVWNDMSGSGGGGGGGGLPPVPPGSIAAQFLGCDPYLYGAIYNEYWSAVAGATSYMLYYSQNPFSGPYWFVAATPLTSQMTETWTDAWDRVRACNANGCSSLSANSVYTPGACW